MSTQPTADRIALAWRQLRRGAVGAQLRRHLLGPDGPRLEQAQLDALEIIATAPDGIRMSDFADEMHVDPSTATRAVDRLERVGLAERFQAEDDRRFVRARATADGRRIVRRVAERRAVGMERLLAAFDPIEREQFANYLERFVGSIDELVTDLAGNDPGG